MTDIGSPYTLWRNDVLLGRIARFPDSTADRIDGLLLPTAAFEDIGPLMQSVLVFERERIVLLHRFTGDEGRGPVALKPLTDQRQGLLPEAQLRVRDPDGIDVPTEVLSIDPTEVPDQAGEFPDFCRALGLSGQAWLFGARRAG